MSQEKKFIKHLLGFYQSQLLAGYYQKRGKASVIPNLVYCLSRLNKYNKQKIRVLDIGCGQGNLLKVVEEIANNLGFGRKIELYGLDFDEDLINQAKQINDGKINYLHRDLRYDLLEDLSDQFDIILCVNTLHEVFSSYLQDTEDGSLPIRIKYAKKKIIELFKQISKLLTENGSLIFYDGLNVSNKKAKAIVKFRIKTKILAHDFDRFINEYRICQLEFKRKGSMIYMRGDDFHKFIATFKFLNSQLWPIESQETYFYFNKKEMVSMIEKMGLIIEYRSLISNDLGLWGHHVELLDENYFDNKSIMIVASKQYLYSDYDYFC